MHVDASREPRSTVKVRKHHVIVSGAVVGVGVLLGFSAAFFIDAAQTDRAYDQLAAHRAPAHGYLLGCFDMGVTRTHAPTVCEYTYSYRKSSFSPVLRVDERAGAYVDPKDPSVHMGAVTFAHGPEAVTGDLAIASTCVAGALVIAITHEVHRSRRRRPAREWVNTSEVAS